ncbi:hypothetical protein [Streptomyces sp. NPDC002394]
MSLPPRGRRTTGAARRGRRARECGPTGKTPGRRVTGDYLLAVTTLKSFARTVARFLTRYGAFLAPTLAQPPLPLGEMTSTEEAALFRLAGRLERTRPWSSRVPDTVP